MGGRMTSGPVPKAPPRDGADLDALGREVAASLDAARETQGAAARVREKLVAREVPRFRAKRPLRLRPRALVGAAAVFAAAAAVALVMRKGSTPPLSFVVDANAESAGTGPSSSNAQAIGTVGAFIAAPAERPLPLAFSDGSSVRLAPSGRARVASLTPAGARVILEQGAAHVHVVHRDVTRWAVEAGPFEVHVTGTTFDVGWDAQSEILVVKMSEGSVVVSGCGLADGRRVVAGDELRTSCRKDGAGTRAVHDLPDAASAAGASAAGASADATGTAGATSHDAAGAATTAMAGSAPTNEAPTNEAPTSARIEPKAARDSSASAIGVLARGGAHNEALAAAERRGFSVACSELEAPDLLALAHAARYSSRFDRAKQAFKTVRDRFTGADAAAAAAFELGRIAFDVDHDPAAAGDWFDTYLRERPNGSLAREALGRALEARSRAGDSRAAALAERYLTLYADGPHAKLAQRIANAKAEGGADPSERGSDR